MLSQEALLCPRHIHLTRRSSGAKSLIWSALAATRLIWRASSSPLPRRSATVSSKPTGRRAAGEEKGDGLSTAERDELARLRRENKQLRV